MTSCIVQPAAPTTVAMFSKTCRVWDPTSGPAIPPSGLVPTCPATTTRPLASIPCEYIPSGRPKPLGCSALIAIALS